MKNIVVLENQEAVVSIQDISKFSGVQTRAIAKAIRTHSEKFRKLGLSLNSDTTHIRHILNEPQATFLMTLLKNTDVVSQFKFDLVVQFYQMREQVCEINKLAVETLKQELVKAKDLKTYKDGYVSLRKFLKKHDKFMKENEAWEYLVYANKIKNTFPSVIKRELVDMSIGRQSDGHAPVFNPDSLTEIFKDFID